MGVWTHVAFIGVANLVRARTKSGGGEAAGQSVTRAALSRTAAAPRSRAGPRSEDALDPGERSRAGTTMRPINEACSTDTIVDVANERSALAVAAQAGQLSVVRVIGRPRQRRALASRDVGQRPRRSNCWWNAAQIPTGATSPWRRGAARAPRMPRRSARRFGMTPLMRAAARGHTHVALWLLESGGALASLLDEDGRSPAMVAAERGFRGGLAARLANSCARRPQSADGAQKP
jgi:hypothetical protein